MFRRALLIVTLTSFIAQAIIIKNVNVEQLDIAMPNFKNSKKIKEVRKGKTYSIEHKYNRFEVFLDNAYLVQSPKLPPDAIVAFEKIDYYYHMKITINGKTRIHPLFKY